MDWTVQLLYIAQRGALDWRPKFKAAVLPVFKDLYASVKSGTETAIVLDKGSQEKLTAETGEMKNSEMWLTRRRRPLPPPGELGQEVRPHM